MVRVGVYARKSTDQHGVVDEAKSVSRQVEHARAYAEEHGWVVHDEYIYIDDGISGAEFKARPGFLRLMSALKPAAPFDVLVISELSRLGREQIETAYALKQLSEAGVRVHSYLQGREVLLETPTDKFLMSAASYAAEVEREKARQRTHDAMSQKARAGHVTGGRVFGYDNVPVHVTGLDGSTRRSHTEHRINEAESDVVRRIFTLRAQGVGISTIAKDLNADHVPTPRPQQGRPAGWAPSSVREVLLRQRYRGRIVWNQTKKRNNWGVAKPSTRPQNEWIEVTCEHLRIVSEELWQAVQRQLESTRKRALGAGSGRARGRPPGAGAKYLLAGLATCSRCGASMEARSRHHGRQRVVFYGCSAYHRKGKSVCANGLTVPADTLEDAVLAAIEEAVLDASVVQTAIDAAVDRLVGDDGAQNRVELTQEIGRLDTELQRLARAIAEGGESTTLTAEIRRQEARRDELSQRIKVSSLEEFKAFRSKPSVRKDLKKRILEWQGLLRRRATQGQQILRKLIDGRLTMTPHAQENTPYYVFEGTGTLTGLLEGIGSHKLASPTGFEPVS